MENAITWGALIAAAAACVGWIKFWMDRGKAEAAATSASAMATAAHGKAEMVSSALNDFKVQVAQQYATTNALEAAEKHMTHAINGVRDEIRGMNGRLDQFLQAMIEERHK
jgi:hypothetical protein